MSALAPTGFFNPIGGALARHHFTFVISRSHAQSWFEIVSKTLLQEPKQGDFRDVGGKAVALELELDHRREAPGWIRHPS